MKVLLRRRSLAGSTPSVVLAASFSLSALSAVGLALAPQTAARAQFAPAPPSKPTVPAKKNAAAPAKGAAKTNAMPAVLPPLSLEDQPFLRLNMKAHTSNIHSIVWSGSQTLATVGQDKTLRFWDAQTAQPLNDPVRFTVGLGDKGALFAAAMSPKGDLLAVTEKNDDGISGKVKSDTANHSDTILLYDAAAKEVRAQIRTDVRLKSVLAWSPDGTKIAALGIKDGRFCQVLVWQIAPNAKTKQLEGKLVKAFPKSLNDDWISEDTEEPAGFLTDMDALAWSPDSSQIATGNHYGTVRIFEAVSGKVVEERDFAAKGRPVRALAWANDPLQKSSTLVVGVEDQIYVWNKATNQFTKQAAGNQVTALAFAPDDSGRIIVGTGSNRTEVAYPVLVWDRRVRNSEPVQIGTHTAPVSAVSFSTDGNLAASADALGHLVVWNPQTGQAQGGWEARTTEARTLPLQKVRWLTRTVDSNEDKTLPSGHVRKAVYGIAWTTSASSEAKGTDASSDSATGLRFDGAYDFEKGALLPSPITGDVEANPDHVAYRYVFADKVEPAKVPLKTVQLNNGPQESAVDVVTQNGDVFAKIALPSGENALCAALVSDTRVLVGTGHGLTLWDIRDAGAPKEVRRYIGYEGVPIDVAVSPDTDANGLLQAEGRYAAVTAADGTLRVFNLHDTEAAALTQTAQIAPNARPKPGDTLYVTPLLSVLPTKDSGLIAWNDRTGVFYALGLSDEVVGWHTNPTKGTLAGTFSTARALQESKEQPEVIKLALNAGTMERATTLAYNAKAMQQAALIAQNKGKSNTLDADMASIAAGSGKVEASLAAMPHITGTWVDDAGRAVTLQNAAEGDILKTKRGAATLQLTAFDAQNKPLTGVSFQLITNRHDGGKGFGMVATRTSTQTVEAKGFAPGTNEVEVVATRTGANGEVLKSAPLYLRFNYTGQNARPLPNLYVLAIGVKDFQDPSINSLRYADKDAEGIADVFKQQKGQLFGKVIVDMLENKAATKKAIEGTGGAIDKMVKAVTSKDFNENPEDLVVVYLSTHGIGNETNPDKPSYYLVPTDGNTETFDSLVNMGDLADKLVNLPARNVVVFIDQCFSGKFSYSVQNAASKAFRATREKQLVTIAASDINQQSWEVEDWRHGAFTYVLLQALRGEFAAAKRAGGIVNVQLALRHVQDEVGRSVKDKLGVTQTPSYYAPAGTNGDNIALTKVPSSPVSPVGAAAQNKDKERK